ncbi:hypothetical protein SUGI_0725660 [Cryptomeria japonica]|uniref:protodermal factor 1 n=1 Tax=Cryptomeria japonica TaxID=3369 RepID=UPI002414A6F9|nr:protodermal factor 1 [Cryptomeria japonica]GLJ36167.1 hypothetical protein SUGI_0725660 [Cryptomeria japonica]
MASKFAIACLALIIFSAAGVSTAQALTSTAGQKNFGQQKGDNDVDGSGGGLPSAGGGYGSNSGPIPDDGASNPPIDAGGDGSGPKDGSGSYPIIPGMGGGPTDHMPTIPNFPFPTHSIPGHGTCDFWSSNFGSWPNFLSTMSTIGSIFGKPASSMYPSSMTLLQALQNTKTDAYSTLVKQASASLLNSYTHKNFGYSPEEVKSLFAAALTSPQAAAAQASQFARANISA